MRTGRGCVGAPQAEFASAEEFPLDFFSGLQADGSGQRHGDVDIGPRLLPLGADCLNFDRIMNLRIHGIAYKLFIVGEAVNLQDEDSMSLPPPKVQRTLFDVPVLADGRRLTKYLFLCPIPRVLRCA